MEQIFSMDLDSKDQIGIWNHVSLYDTLLSLLRNKVLEKISAIGVDLKFEYGK